MKTTLCMMSLALLFSMGCGRGEDEPPEETPEPMGPPVLGERPIMVYGAPEDEGENNGTTVSEYPRDEPDFGSTNEADQGPGFCCPTTFAITDPDGTDDELSVVLSGNAYPLNENLALSYSNGIWSVETCVSPEYNGTYSYLFSKELDGEVSTNLVVNEYAPTKGRGKGIYNVWLTSEDCEGSRVELHARTEGAPR